MEKYISPGALAMLRSRCESKNILSDPDIQNHICFLDSVDFSRSILTDETISELKTKLNMQSEMVLVLLSMSFRYPVEMRIMLFKKIFDIKITENKIYNLQQEFVVTFISEFKDFSFEKNRKEGEILFNDYGELSIERKNVNTFKRVLDCFMMIKVFPRIYIGKVDSSTPPKRLLKPKKDQGGY